MTLYEIVRKFENLALAAPNVRTAADGNVYDAMNDNPKLKYGVFFVSQDTHQEFEQMDRYGLTLFYIDRLDDTLEDNRLQIQSIGKEILSTVIRDFCEEYDVDLPTMNYIPFTEKFKDLTAGIYVQITIEVFKDDCYDDFSEVKSVYQTKVVDIYHNGEYSIQPDKDYTALKEVIVNVNVECSGCTPEQLEEAYQSGRTDQKNLLSTTAFTENGSYSSENGWSGVTINVPTGSTINNQNKSISFSANTSTTITYDGGYTGLESVSIEVNVPQTGYTQQDLDDAYASGYTSGRTDQKNLLTTTAFTQNGEFSLENGWSGVTVAVPQTGYTQEDLDDAYNRGYDDGYNSRSRLTVSPAEIYKLNSSGTTTIQLLSNTDWVVDSIPSWCSLSSMSGTGDATLTLTVNSNTGASRRNKVVFKTTDNYATGQTIINQEEVDGTISVVPSSNNLHYNAQTLTLTATSNVPWTILDYPDWAVPNITSGTSGTTTIIVTLPENTGAERRGYINFNTNYGDASASVYIRQGINTTKTLDITPSSYTYQHSGGTLTLTVTSNTSWKVSSAPSWCNMSTTAGTGNSTITVSANATSAYRKGVITVTTNDLTLTDTTNIEQIEDYVPKGNTKDYLTFTVLTGGTLGFLSNTGIIKHFYYSINGKNWIEKYSGTYSQNLPSITVKAGDVIRFRGNICYNSNCTYANNLQFICRDGLKMNIQGNIMSMINPSNYSGLTSLSSYTGAFQSMFSGLGNDTGSGIIDASGLILPATSLGVDCYRSMFYGSQLLTSAPTLPATTLVEGCYSYMFQNSPNLNSVKCLATDISATNCTTAWLSNVANSGTFTKNVNMSSWTTGVNGIPSGWTIVNV